MIDAKAVARGEVKFGVLSHFLMQAPVDQVVSLIETVLKSEHLTKYFLGPTQIEMVHGFLSAVNHRANLDQQRKVLDLCRKLKFDNQRLHTRVKLDLECLLKKEIEERRRIQEVTWAREKAEMEARAKDPRYNPKNAEEAVANRWKAVEYNKNSTTFQAPPELGRIFKTFPEPLPPKRTIGTKINCPPPLYGVAIPAPKKPLGSLGHIFEKAGII